MHVVKPILEPGLHLISQLSGGFVAKAKRILKGFLEKRVLVFSLQILRDVGKFAGSVCLH